MAGNAWEWIENWYDGAEKYRVLRGGSWRVDAWSVREALFFRGFQGIQEDVGFRVARAF